MLVVVLQSIWGGFGSSAIVSVIAALSLDYFFIPPVLTWRISDPEYGVALVTYCLTSLVITRLASRARNEALVAERRRRDAGLLYDAASRLLSLAPEVAAGPESLRIFREVFDLRCVSFFDAASGQLRIEGASLHELGRKTRDAGIEGSNHRDRDRGLYLRCLYAGETIVGAIGFEGRFADEAVALPLSALAATALERMRSFSSAARASADAQAEMLRSAMLDAFAHEFKTPLAIILAAAGGLRETNGEPRAQLEMTDIIEDQTLRLNQLTTRLLRIARLDRENVTPSMEPTSLHALVGNLIGQCQRQFGRQFVARLGGEPVEVMADPELLGLAINQLLDNACKYSPLESAVIVELDVQDGFAGVRVTNEGSSIRPAEREQIFERFYRGTETEHVTPGAGLGLYVARKILRAHGGVLELDRNRDSPAATTFRIGLPVNEYERQHQQEAPQSIGSGR